MSNDRVPEIENDQMTLTIWPRNLTKSLISTTQKEKEATQKSPKYYPKAT